LSELVAAGAFIGPLRFELAPRPGVSKMAEKKGQQKWRTETISEVRASAR
jgi:hypothetical protein